MMIELFRDFGFYAITGLFGVIFWFIRERMSFLDKQIALLFIKHDDDVDRLVQLEQRISREHYVKGELDNRFQRLEDAFSKGFNDLGNKLDKLATILTDHMLKDK